MSAMRSAARKVSKVSPRASRAKVATKAHTAAKPTKAAKAPAAKVKAAAKPTKAAKAPAAKVKAAAKPTKATKAPAAKTPAAKPTKVAAAKAKAAAKPTKARAYEAARAPRAPASRASARAAVAGQFVTQRDQRIDQAGKQGHRTPNTRHARIDQAVGRYRELLETVDQSLRDRLIDAIIPDLGTPESAPRPDEALWGQAPSEAATSAAELAQLRTGFERRRALAEHSVTRHDAAKMLGISSQAVTDYLQQGGLAGIKEGNRWLIPLWQFDADCERGFLPGISAVMEAFPGGVVSLSRWVTAPNPNFDNRSPREQMAAGNADSVVAAAAALTAAGW